VATLFERQFRSY